MVKILKCEVRKTKRAKFVSDDINELIGYAPVKKSTKVRISPISKVKLTPEARNKLSVVAPPRGLTNQSKTRTSKNSPTVTLKSRQIKPKKVTTRKRSSPANFRRAKPVPKTPTPVQKSSPPAYNSGTWTAKEVKELAEGLKRVGTSGPLLCKYVPSRDRKSIESQIANMRRRLKSPNP